MSSNRSDGGVRDDTIKMIMASSKERLAEVTALLDQGRITRESRKIQANGPWCIGSVYQTDSVRIKMFVSSLSSELAVVMSFPVSTIYIGIKNKCRLHLGSFHKLLLPGNVGYVDADENHMLEPIDVGCQVLQVLVERNG